MIEDEIISRLTGLGIFALVEGLAQLAALEAAPPATPAAYVFEKETAAGPNERLSSILQKVEADYCIVVVVRNVADATGAAAIVESRPIEAAAISSLLGWQPLGAVEPIELVGTTTVRATGGVVWREITIHTAWYLES